MKLEIIQSLISNLQWSSARLEPGAAFAQWWAITAARIDLPLPVFLPLKEATIVVSVEDSFEVFAPPNSKSLSAEG
jgi:hypothetical protein